MDSALIVSSSEKSGGFFSEMLNNYSKIVTVATGGEARRLLIENDFDLCIINAPLRDENGINLAENIINTKSIQVLLLVKNDFYDEVCEAVEIYGIYTISKPVNKNLFWSALRLMSAADNRLKKMKNQNSQLIQKLDDIKLVDRAKCALIEYLRMSEAEAHRFIEREAMDKRQTKREIAENLLRVYDS